MDIKLKTLKTLRIPFDRNFYNMPLTHYTALCEEIGTGAVLRYVRELIVANKGDQRLAEKARYLIRKLEERFLLEAVLETETECECGFLILEDFEKCPVCGKQFYEGKECYYKQDDLCTIDAKECKWSSYTECGKLEQEG